MAANVFRGGLIEEATDISLDTSPYLIIQNVDFRTEQRHLSESSANSGTQCTCEGYSKIKTDADVRTRTGNHWPTKPTAWDSASRPFHGWSLFTPTKKGEQRDVDVYDDGDKSDHEEKAIIYGLTFKFNGAKHSETFMDFTLLKDNNHIDKVGERDPRWLLILPCGKNKFLCFQSAVEMQGETSVPVRFLHSVPLWSAERVTVKIKSMDECLAGVCAVKGTTGLGAALSHQQIRPITLSVISCKIHCQSPGGVTSPCERERGCLR
ncbi:hypothetical protein EI555_015840 [Monodon monoceros]|uniref:Uncharacterized protein n=1 Tax=Monodon monoceros TaxID=40151 RepID=A0A4V5PB71_MONMO|nr:hypothetical protein EI555_015840 [Monodon monoceros]